MAKSFFKPRHNDNNFVLAVGMTAAKMLLFVVLLLMVSGAACCWAWPRRGSKPRRSWT